MATFAGAQDNKPEPRSIIVTGNGTVRADPDVAYVRLGVSSRAKTAKQAQEQTNEAMVRFYKALADLRIDRKDIKTSQLTLNAYYDNPKPGQRPEIAGYEADNVLTVRVTDFAKIGSVIDAGVDSGVNNMQGVSFGLVDDTQARLEALKAASREAKAKAEAIASALGVRLGVILVVNEGGSYTPPMMEYARGDAMNLKAGVPVSPGQLDVTANVSVRFEIKN